MNKKRISKVFKQISLPYALTTSPSDIKYFTGLDAEGVLLLNPSKSFLFLSPLYPYRAEYIKKLDEFYKLKIKKIAVEPSKISLKLVSEIKKKIRCQIFPVDFLFSKVRAIKEKSEIEKIAKSQEISKDILRKLKIKTQDSEVDVSRKLIKKAIDLADGLSFEPIVAFGKNSFFPHHKSSNAKFKKKFALIDFGVKKDGYCSDLTQMFGLSNMNRRLKEAYRVLRKAVEILCLNIKEGAVISGAVQVASNFLEKMGFSKNILHSFGHGIGLDIHEWPSISLKEKGKFQNGMVFTIEPGLYFEGFGGVRIEDVFVLWKGKVIPVSEWRKV